MNFVPRGKTVNTAYIIEALTRFLRVLKEQRPAIAALEQLISLGQCTCADLSRGDHQDSSQAVPGY
jgi:hypothetical protein